LDISDKIILLRRKKHLTQEKLAQKIGVSTGLVIEWEKAQSRPDSVCVRRMCKLFEVKREDLLDDRIDLRNNPFRDFWNALNIIARHNMPAVLASAVIFLIVGFILILAAIKLKSMFYAAFAIVAVVISTVAFILHEKNKK
jgi:DNA-binding XRE family transcriptional regulator